MDSVSKALIFSGLTLIIVGIIWHLTGGNIPFGRLPGDIRIEKESSTFYFPITSCLIISLFLSLISFILKK